MSRRVGVIVLTVGALAGAACSSTAATPTSPSGEVGAERARAYVEEAVALMQANSLHRHRIDWTDFRQRVFAVAATARTLADTVPALQLALRLLADNHSFFQDAAGSLFIRAGGACPATQRSEPTVPSDVGYLWVRGYSGPTSGAAAYAELLQADIARQDRDDLAGWVVDIRNNTGGNMWPMIAGMGPLLGEGVTGHFIDADRVVSEWGYRDGGSFLDERTMVQVGAAYQRRSRSARVAVLTDGASRSSGEAAFIAWQGRPETRTFGQPTCGLSTSNRGFPLSDGGTLILTTALMADRRRTEFGGPVVTDEIIADGVETFTRAVSWVRDGR